MEMLIWNKYILKNPDKKKLKEQGFRYNKRMSDSDVDFYSIKFPVLQYLKTTTVDGEIVVDTNTGTVRLNAYNHGTKYCYPPFYQEYIKIYEPVMKKINRNFKRMLNKIGAKEEE